MLLHCDMVEAGLSELFMLGANACIAQTGVQMCCMQLQTTCCVHAQLHVSKTHLMQPIQPIGVFIL